MREFNIAVLSGDGIGPEVMEEAIRVLSVIEEQEQVKFNYQYGKSDRSHVVL